MFFSLKFAQFLYINKSCKINVNQRNSATHSNTSEPKNRLRPLVYLTKFLLNKHIEKKQGASEAALSSVYVCVLRIIQGKHHDMKTVLLPPYIKYH